MACAEGQNTGAMANSVLAIVDTARDSKQEYAPHRHRRAPPLCSLSFALTARCVLRGSYAVMRARLVQHFDALKVSAAAPAPAPTAAAPAKAAPAAAKA